MLLQVGLTNELAICKIQMFALVIGDTEKKIASLLHRLTL